MQVQRCPFPHSTRDLLYTLVNNGISTGGGGPIADGSITEAKLANGAVTSGKIANGAVTSSKLAAASVSPIVSTTKTVGLGIGTDGELTFDTKGRITAIQEATP